MWKGSRAQEALLGGVFSRSPFNGVGTVEEPCPYTGKVPDRDAFKGRQFATAATGSLFDKHFKQLFQDDVYVDKMPYRELQPDRPPPGFGTSDYSKRDEFSLTIRMEQHRQQMHHEAHAQKMMQQRLQARSPGPAAGAAQQQNRSSPQRSAAAPLLFDRVHGAGPDLCSRAKRGTHNTTMLSSERRVGPYKTTAMLAHRPPESPAIKPLFGHRPIMEATQRPTNVFFPPGCAAEPRSRH